MKEQRIIRNIVGFEPVSICSFLEKLLRNTQFIFYGKVFLYMAVMQYSRLEYLKNYT